jgi:hypothetical protein
MNDDFVAAHCGPDAAVGANLLYEDSRSWRISWTGTMPAGRTIMVIRGRFTARRSNTPK